MASKCAKEDGLQDVIGISHVGCLIGPLELSSAIAILSHTNKDQSLSQLPLQLGA